MHKRAKERMVLTRGGIRKLSAELQDELLKSEFFLPLLLHGRFVCELTHDDDVLVRFKEDHPVKSTQVGGFQGLFSVIASKGLITTQAVEIMQRIFKQVSREPQFVRSGRQREGGGEDEENGSSSQPPRPVNQVFNEMSRVLGITDEVRPQSLHHRLFLALLIYIFNFHNQTQLLPPAKPPFSSPSSSSSSSSSLSCPSSSSCSTTNTKLRHPYLEILSNVALELSQPSNPTDPNSVTEREVTLWTMVAIGAASSFSPWRLEIPFMGHLIEWMEKDHEDGDGGEGEKKNLEKLTACLRGYYLYGADKQTLRSLQKWKTPDASRESPRPPRPAPHHSRA
ncbi:uncharacterized protein A1O5_05582 [Cladophialophora psammophila CBS 110553]|uniref:Uncharacterized protein n=1 Tax=Cladophialophora psammophila CBS 110553 TaxID=1182543 RepID=W9WU87_9EURO|nr:uncharacterized protein A1O5_05582 [Cladophialophora psammophila CBS 110553]EXJ71772.1 hypothetical protein A1O5_05582 [Cladophialophora psammophila CBS 110553]